MNAHRPCFVIMPFSESSDTHSEEYWNLHYRDFLKPLIEEVPGLTASRSQPLRGDIIREIITHLVSDPIVVADLTDANPNVYWELGVRQSFMHGTITIAELGTRLPSDIGSKGTLFYHAQDHIKMEGFRKGFKRALEDCVSNPSQPDSVVLEAITGRGTLFQIIRRDEAARRLEALVSELESLLQTVPDTIKSAKKNIAKPEGRSFPTERCRVSALELFVTSRYADADGTARLWLTHAS